MYKRILVPTDGSTLSRKAARTAIALAGAVGAELVALTIVPRYPTTYFEGGIAHTPEDIARTEQHWANEGRALVERVRLDAEKAGVQARACTSTSDLVAEAILAAARKHRCDLIVMASHGRKGLQRLLLGSETQHVLTHGHVPVLVLR
jgi:nucleotide-binding universal stress UspA family protein